MADKLYGEFRENTKKLQRLRSIYRSRAGRAKAAGLFENTYLSQIDNINLGYKVEDDGVTIKEDNFSAKKFKASDAYHKQQLLVQAQQKVKYLTNVLANPMSSLSGMKDIIKRDLKTDKLDMNSATVRAKLDSFRQSPEGYFKHAQAAQLMDAIDARTDLTDSEKSTLKTLIRTRLSRRERVDYDSSFIEWDMDIEELLKDPKGFIDTLSEGIPDDILQELIAEAGTLETTDNPSHLPW